MANNTPIAENWLIDNWNGYYSFNLVTDSSGMGAAPSPPSYPQSLSTQNHVDLRTFATTDEHWESTNAGEPYTWAGSYGFLSSFNHWPGVSINMPSSSTFVFMSTAGSVDLTSLSPESLITLALPSFPLSYITTASTYLDISSDGFGAATDSLQFSASTTTLIAGNSTGTWPLSDLVNSNPAAITDVRLRITTTATCTLVMMALRVIDPAWVQTNIDFDNWNGWLRQCIPLNGSTSAIPVASSNIIQDLYRAASTGSQDDPQPIQGEIGLVFNTGSRTAQNGFTLYMREIDQPGITMQALANYTQAQLTGVPQPQYGPADGVPRSINFKVAWGEANMIQITNYDNGSAGYQWSGSSFPTLSNNTAYLAICNLYDATARLQIYSLNQTNFAIETLVFDTGPIADTYLFIRRPGRVGFLSYLNDGDAYIRSIAPRSLVFAEYISAPLASITPVSGANLFVNGTPDTELWSGWSLVPSNGGTVLQGDPVRTLSGLSSEISVLNPAITGQGIISNYLSPPGDSVSGITDMSQVQITFSLWFQSAALNAGATVIAYLLSADGAIVPLNMPKIIPDQWQQVILLPPPAPIQSGLYSLAVVFVGDTSTTFWVDEVSVTERALSWSARSVVSNPWNSNDAPWTDFRELINSYVNGVHFSIRGTTLQVRGQALVQDAAIVGYPKIVPQYAQLGRLVWPEDAHPSDQSLTGPGATISVATTGLSCVFQNANLTSPNGVISNQWSFGDSTLGNGVAVSHTYATAGTYDVYLSVTDSAGLVATATTIVTVI